MTRRRPRPDERVRVHMNLNTGDVAVRGFEPGDSDYNKTLLQTVHVIELADVSFRVQDAAYEAVVDEGVRDVCAYAVGRWRGHDAVDADAQSLRYNPFEHKHFFIPGDDEIVHEAPTLFVWSESSPDGPKGRMAVKLNSTQSN